MIEVMCRLCERAGWEIMMLEDGARITLIGPGDGEEFTVELDAASILVLTDDLLRTLSTSDYPLVSAARYLLSDYMDEPEPEPF